MAAAQQSWRSAIPSRPSGCTSRGPLRRGRARARPRLRGDHRRTWCPGPVAACRARSSDARAPDDHVRADLPGTAPARRLRTGSCTWCGSGRGGWRTGDKPQGIATPPGPLHFPLLCQAMAVARLLEGPEASLAILQHIEGLLTPSQVDDDPTAAPEHAPVAGTPVFSGFLPAYFHFAATTAIMAGDLDCARRNLHRLEAPLRADDRRLTDAPRVGRTAAAGMPATAGCWSRSAASPSPSWSKAICAVARPLSPRWTNHRARRRGGAEHHLLGGRGGRPRHLSYELGDPAPAAARERQARPSRSPPEYWPLLAVAQAAWIRRLRTTCLALAHLRAGLAEIPACRGPPAVGRSTCSGTR